MKQLTLGLLSICLSFHAWAAAKGGGGGAGFKVAGEYITWDESGLKLKKGKEYSDWDIDADTYIGLDNYVSTLPFGEYYKQLAIGDKNYFKVVDKKEISGTLHRKIKSEYKSCFEDTGHNFNKDLVIYAVSTNEQTYLLPEFFKLNPERRAKVLIHEGNVRHYGFNCDVLRIDEQLAKANEIYENGGEKSDVNLFFLAKQRIPKIGVSNDKFIYKKLQRAIISDYINKGLPLPAELFLNQVQLDIVKNNEKYNYRMSTSDSPYVARLRKFNDSKKVILNQKTYDHELFLYQRSRDSRYYRFKYKLMKRDELLKGLVMFSKSGANQIDIDNFKSIKVLETQGIYHSNPIDIEDSELAPNSQTCSEGKKAITQLFTRNFWNLAPSIIISHCKDESGEPEPRATVKIKSVGRLLL